MAKGEAAVVGKFSARQRSYGRDIYRRIVSILTGTPVRDVAQATQRLWEELSIGSKNTWAQLAELFKLGEVQGCVQELSPDPSSARRRVSEVRRSCAEEVDKATVANI